MTSHQSAPPAGHSLPGTVKSRSTAVVLTSAPRSDHSGLEKVLHAADFSVTFCDDVDAAISAVQRSPHIVVVDLRAAIPGTTAFLNRLSAGDRVPQTIFWGTGPTRVGVVEFDQTVRLNWLSGAWHLDTLQQLEARLRTRDRPRVVLMAAELRTALQAGEIELRYQPTMDLRRMDAHSPVEALLRWRHPNLGLLTASEFMPAAEEPRLRQDLTDFALLKAIEQLKAWQLAGIKTGIAVNLEASLLKDVQFPRRLTRLVNEHHVDPARLELEVSERGVMSGTPETAAIIEALVERDFRLSLDDFGGTQISLQQVLLLPFSQLKISAALVHSLGASERARRLTRGLIHLAHDLDMLACGKGVETSEQMLLLQALGCDAAQGWYVGGPVEASELADAVGSSEAARDDSVAPQTD